MSEMTGAGSATKKLQWETKHSTDFKNEQDFLETILVDCGVSADKINAFLHPVKKYLHDPLLMNNMAEAVELVHKHVKNGSKIFVRVDCDVDGISSSGALIQFLHQLNPSIQIDYKLNYEKQHGLTYKDMSTHTKSEYGLIIIPDASMTVRDAQMITKNFTADILVLDHHLIENEYLDTTTGQWITRDEAKEIYKTDKERIKPDCYTNYCIAVNCTDGNYPNPNLCGAGVVQKFIEAYMDRYEEEDDLPEDLRNEYLDLISLGQISDATDVRDLEVRYYVLEGLKERNNRNEFLNELALRKAEDMKWGRTIMSMGWTIGPLINGVIRYGKPEEQEDMFKAILGVQEDREYQPRRKSKNDPLPPMEIHSLQKTMARVCENVKGRQDTEVRKFVGEIDKEIQEKQLDKSTILFVDGTKILEKGTVSGLVANKLASKYFRPVVLMRSKDALTYGGSMRGYDKSPIKDTKAFLEECGCTINGHSNAAGFLLPKAKLNEVIAKCNKKLPLDQLCTIHQVDWEIPAAQLRKEFVQEVAENYPVFGNTVPEPTFAITNLRINASEIQAYGAAGTFIRFVYNGITFVKKYCTHNDFDNMTLKSRNTLGVNKKELNINCIAKFILTSYEDQIYPEVQILEFDSEEVKVDKTEEKKAADWDFEEAPKKKIKEDFDFDF